MNLPSAILRVRDGYRRKMSKRFGQRMVEICPRFPIISFTFDDFPGSALHRGGAILKKHGVVGTYYVSLGLMGQMLPAGRAFCADDIRKAVAEGHELGCHTYSHCHSWETEPSLFEKSILENQHALRELLPGAIFKSLSYPISCPRPRTKRRTAKYFSCSRGGGDLPNVGECDANYLQACFLEKNTHRTEYLQDLIRKTCSVRGWLIFATHDVCESPTRFGCTPKFFENIVQQAVASGAVILPVGKAWEALQNG